MQDDYEQWLVAEASAHISNQFSDDTLRQRLKEISSRLRKDRRTNAALDRMTPEARKTEFLRVLRREVAGELGLPSLEDWKSVHPQCNLFQS